jgi:hypothetical protein
MATKKDLLEIERELREAKISVARLCRMADVHQTTWVKWKRVDGAIERAQPRTWAAIEQAKAALLPGRAA